MMKLFRYRRPIVYVLSLLLMIMFTNLRSHASTQVQEDVSISNVKWRYEDNIIIITYDLNAPADEKYEVSVVMMRENDDAFEVTPRAVEGDIGEGNFSGVGREIRWNYKKEFPSGFRGEGYYFEVHVKPSHVEKPWVYLALGAVAVAGGVVGLLVGLGQGGNPPAGTNELPLPPGRP